MIKNKKKFRKLSLGDYRIEDDITKLEYIFNQQKKNKYLNEYFQTKKEKNQHRNSLPFHSSTIAQANEENVKTLFHIFRKKF